MSIEAAHPDQHPLLSMLDELEAVREKYADVPTWSLTPAEITEAIPRLVEHRRALDGTHLGLLREADRHQVGDPIGHANTAGWYAAVTRTTKTEAHRLVRLAAELDAEEHDPTRVSLVRGEISVERAAVIVRSVDELPTDLTGLTDTDIRGRAEQHLLELAAHHDPRELRLLGRRILEVHAPDVAEEVERRALEAEERHAAATASFVMRPDGHGSMVGRFKIPLLAGRILEKHLNAIVAPKHQISTGSTGSTGLRTDDTARVARPLRWGTAFVEYLETREATGVPRAGGVPATVVVTMTLDSLLGGLAAASLDSGDRISAAEARRLTCEAGMMAAVLGSSSQILDLGRKARFHTEPQRVAIAHRDKTCRAEHCDWPPGMCHVHHPQPWSRGGPTSVENGMLLCPRHHTLAHDTRYEMTNQPNGRVRFIRRT